MSDPTNVSALEDLVSVLACTEALLVESKLTAAIGKLMESEQDTLGMDHIDEAEISELEVSDEFPASTRASTPPTMTPHRQIHPQDRDGCHQARGSDLHFEPYETKYRIRFRVDGILRSRHRRSTWRTVSRLAPR